MSQEAMQALQEELDLTRQELNLMVVIDRIRDTVADPLSMLSAIIGLLVNELHAELGLLWLPDQQTQRLTLKIIDDRHQKFDALIALTNRILADQAMKLNHATVWTANHPPLVDIGPQLPPNLQVAALPIMVKQTKRLGVALLARTTSPFTPNEIHLLQAAESQIDSAIIQAYAHFDLQRRIIELDTIYRIDRIRDQGLAFDDMLDRILYEVQQSLKAEISFVMLYDRAGRDLEMRAATHDALLQPSAEHELVRQVAHEALAKGNLVHRNDLNQAVSAVLCLPLILNDQIIGVLGAADCYDARGFDYAKQQLLIAIGSQIDTAIFESIELRRLRQLLGRSVDPRVMQRLLTNADVEFLKGERLVLTVLYADLRGSTELAERIDPEALVDYMNQFLGRMTEVILAHEGTLDKFIGDQVMAIFGAPFSQPDHALRAVRTAMAMQAAHQSLMDAWRSSGHEPVSLGIGIATGELIVGEMGSPQQTDYTVVGRAANLGARICAIAEGDQILISQATYELVETEIAADPLKHIHLKGIGQDITVFSVKKGTF